MQDYYPSRQGVRLWIWLGIGPSPRRRRGVGADGAHFSPRGGYRRTCAKPVVFCHPRQSLVFGSGAPVPPPATCVVALPEVPASRPRVGSAPSFPLLGAASVLLCGSRSGRVCCQCLLSGRVSTLFPPQVGSVPGRARGAMASRGRKRKAEAAAVAVEKREKLASGREGVEEAAVVIEHW